MKKLLIILFFSHLGLSQAANSPPPEGIWNSALKSCAGLSVPHFQRNLPQFKTTLQDGKKWEQRNVVFQKQLSNAVNVSCPAYLANPNGDQSLKKFVGEYTSITTEALDLSRRADSIQGFLQMEAAEAKKYLKEGFGVIFESSSCSKSINQMTTFLVTERKNTETQFGQLKTKCPAIAQAQLITAQQAAKKSAVEEQKGRSAPATTPSAPGGRESDISGTEEKKP